MTRLCDFAMLASPKQTTTWFTWCLWNKVLFLRLCSRISLLNHMKTPPFYIVVEVRKFPDFKFSQGELASTACCEETEENKNIMAIINDNNYQDTTTNKFKHARTRTMVEANIQRRSEHGRPQTTKKNTNRQQHQCSTQKQRNNPTSWSSKKDRVFLEFVEKALIPLSSPHKITPKNPPSNQRINEWLRAGPPVRWGCHFGPVATLSK